MVAAAVIGGAVIGGVATSMSGNKAAGAQRDAAQMSTDEQRRQFDITQENIKPFREAGLSVLPELQSGAAPGGEFNRNFTMADFQKDPGYQFRMDQGQQALERSAAAGGGLLSGGTGKALAQYGQDYASGEYSNAYNRFNNDQTTRFNRLSALAGTGQTATNTLATLGAQTSQNIGENYLQAGNARAAGYIGQGNAVNNGVSSLGNFYLQQQYLNRIPQSTSTTPGIYSGSGLPSGGYAVA